MAKVSTRRTRPSGFWFIPFGILLPVVALLVELNTRMCGEAIFDPIPTWWHVAAVALVPVANGYLWHLLYHQRHQARDWGRLINGMVLGITGFYAVLFLPLLPFGVIGIAFVGIGFLPLAPLLAFLVGYTTHRYLSRMPAATDGPAPEWYRTRYGIAAALVLLIGFEGQGTLTRVGLQMAGTDTPAVQQSGLSLLRQYGSEEILRRACYRSVSFERDIVGFVASWFFDDPVWPEDARTLYYRVTGRAFNELPPPTSLGSAIRFDWDWDEGGTQVGGQVRGLNLVHSQIDGSVDAAAAVQYTEWTLAFENTAERNHEARAQVKLPPGGVVSRVTLWIDGEPREAAFGGRGQTRAAYEAVVRRNRDPLLVTTQGPDRVMVQCFPVLPGQTMQIRLGITAPLVPVQDGRAWLSLPHFTARNFALPETLRHEVWMAGTTPFLVADPMLRATQDKSDEYAVRGLLPDAALTAPEATMWVAPQTPATGAWSEDPWDPTRLIVQTRTAQASKFPSTLAVVVDGSAGMAEVFAQVAALLPDLAAQTKLYVYLADDNATLLYADTPDRLETAQAQLRAYQASGGRDNVPALSAAWQRLAGVPNGAVLWLHGPQPVLFGEAEAWTDRMADHPGGRLLFEMQVVPGRNRIVERLGQGAAVQALHPRGDLRGDVLRALHGTAWHLTYAAVPRATVRVDPQHQTSAHLARLWAYDEVRRTLATGTPEAATALAVQYQLVTPVSGAVVLETQAQYDAAGLEPVEPGSVPTIPEPEMWLLLLIVALALGGYTYLAHRRRTLQPGLR